MNLSKHIKKIMDASRHIKRQFTNDGSAVLSTDDYVICENCGKKYTCIIGEKLWTHIAYNKLIFQCCKNMDKDGMVLEDGGVFFK